MTQWDKFLCSPVLPHRLVLSATTRDLVVLHGEWLREAGVLLPRAELEGAADGGGLACQKVCALAARRLLGMI